MSLFHYLVFVENVNISTRKRTIGVISILLRFVQKCVRTLPAVNIRKNIENSMIVANFVMNGF